MLELENARVIGMGNDRRVYQDPNDPHRCIKVPRYPDKGSRQNEREQRYFEGLVRRGMRDWSYVPAYHGSVATAEGLGTCAQEYWSVRNRSVREFVGAPEHELLFCGMSIGRVDTSAPINTFRSERMPLDEWARFV